MAGRLAGLEKVKLMREPEAAALAYGIDKVRRSVCSDLSASGYLSPT